MTPPKLGPLDAAGLDMLLSWAQAEGWSPGLNDGPCFFAADPEGFFGAWVHGEMVGGVAAIRYGANYGFIGLLIVKPSFRGGDIDPRLFQLALEHLGDRTIGLDSVLSQESHYQRLFGFAKAHGQVRYLGKAGAMQWQSRPAKRETVTVVDLAKLPDGVVQSFDSLYFPGPRASFLRSWIHAPRHLGKALLHSQLVLGHEVKTLIGYGVLRPTPMGQKIGPLFAKSAEIAQILVESLVAGLAEEDPVLWDLPKPNQVACRLADNFGMKPVFETVRMYKGEVPSIAPETVFGITTFELG